MEIYEKVDGSILSANRIMEYATSIVRDYKFGKDMEGSTREMFMNNAFGEFAMAQTELNSEELIILDDILKQCLTEGADNSKDKGRDE